MRRFVWAFAWASVAIWSLFCAVAYGVFNVVGGWATRNADMFASDPQTVEWIWRVFSWIHSLSLGAVTFGWGVVSLMMLAVPWLFDRLVPIDVRAQGRGAPGWAPPPTRDGVIDLAPDQYSVRPGATAAPVPRVTPRG